MASSFPWLAPLVALPALGVLLPAAIPGLRKTVGKGFALVVSLLELASAIGAVLSLDWAQSSSYQLLESHPWIAQMGITWSLDVNALGLMMILLAVALVPFVLLAGWNEDENEAEAGVYAALVLFLEMFMVVIFVAFDLVIFYTAFEVMLIPLFFMIGCYGVSETQARRAVAMKFLLYSLAGGLVVLGGIIVLWAFAPQHSVAFFRLDQLAITSSMLSTTVQMGAFISFMIALATKAPMVPPHTWLPGTTAVPCPGISVFLVGALDKTGTFGTITLCLRLFPETADQARWVFRALAVLLIIRGGLVVNGQDNTMRLVPCTSVPHFGFMVLGIFIGFETVFVGVMFYMVAYGVSIAAIFPLSGWSARHGGTQDMRGHGGIQCITPYLADLWLTSGLASIALPDLLGFVPEHLVLMGTWEVDIVLACFVVLGVIIAAVYVLMPYQRVFTGESVRGKDALPDLDLREKSVMAPLIVTMLVLGMYSAPLVRAFTPIASDSTLGDVSSAVAQTPLEGSSK